MKLAVMWLFRLLINRWSHQFRGIDFTKTARWDVIPEAVINKQNNTVEIGLRKFIVSQSNRPLC